MKNLKISISAYGKYDLFRWAEGFEKKNLLFKLLTDFYSEKFPFLSRRRKDMENIDIKRVEIFFWPRLFQPIFRNLLHSSYFENFWFDKWASKKTLGSDIVIVRSSCALETIRSAKSHGIKTILYRGSSEIRYQYKIRNEELKKFGLKEERPDERFIKRELEEYRLADYIYVPSSYAAKTYIGSGVNPGKIIHFPLSVEKVNQPPLRKHGSRGKLNVIYVGNISVAKGIPYFLEAAQGLNARKDIVFTLVGGIFPEMKLIKEKYEGNINYVGYVPHHKIANFYEEADIFVFPTIDDGFGQVMLEAMSYGLPVIATDHSGGPDIIKDGVNGFVVPAKNSEKILEKIMFFYENPQKLREMGEEAQKTTNNFSIDKFTEKWVDFFVRAGWTK